MTLAACADGQLGLVAPFAVVVFPGRVEALPGPKCAEIMPSAVAQRVVAALALLTKRLGRWRRHGAALGASGAGARLFCAAARRRGRSARRGRGSGAGSPLLPGVTATAMPRALAEAPIRRWWWVASSAMLESAEWVFWRCLCLACRVRSTRRLAGVEYRDQFGLHRALDGDLAEFR